MQKHILFFIACLLTAASFAQPAAAIPEGEFGVDYNVTDGKGLKQGLWVRVYQNSKLYYLGQFKDNVPQGEFWFWYETGEPMSQVQHLDGTRHMHTTHYHKNGRKMSTGHYREVKNQATGEVDKVRDGAWEFFNDQGALKSKEIYTLGIKNGLQISYFDSGKILVEEYFKNDLRDGKYIEYYETGRIRSERNYLAGKFHGEIKLFEPNGQLRTKGNYIEGQKDGIWMDFNDDGTIKITSKYKLDEELYTRFENGEFTDYFPNGIPMATYTYENAKKNGPFTEWFDMGRWIQEPIDEPLPGGGIQFKERLVDTQMKCQGDYLDDRLEGTVTWYNEQGRVMRIEEYVNGELISTVNK